MSKVNPYRPGAGLMPTYLAGRDDDIQEMEELFDALLLNIPTQSVIFSGLRGVGKTVLINRIQRIAEDKGIFCKHIEVEERNDFVSQIASCSQAFLRKLSAKESFHQLIQKPLDAIKSLVVSFDPNESTFSLSVQERELYKSTSLTQSLTEVFTSLGEAASKANTPICFFVDEIQYMKKNELGALISALHRVNQLSYPIMMVGAGLPKIYSMLSAEKSYSERDRDPDGHLWRYRKGGAGRLCRCGRHQDYRFLSQERRQPHPGKADGDPEGRQHAGRGHPWEL